MSCDLLHQRSEPFPHAIGTLFAALAAVLFLRSGPPTPRPELAETRPSGTPLAPAI
jgi:hypothetical protein